MKYDNLLECFSKRPFFETADLLTLFNESEKQVLPRWKDLQPNIPYLQNVLIQTNYSGDPITLGSWKSVIGEYARSLNWGQIQDDVKPFIISSGDSNLVDLHILLDLLH